MRLLLLLFLLLEKGGEVQSRLLKLRVSSLCHHVTLTNTHTYHQVLGNCTAVFYRPMAAPPPHVKHTLCSVWKCTAVYIFKVLRVTQIVC